LIEKYVMLITYRIRLAGNNCCRVSNVKRVKILLRLILLEQVVKTRHIETGV
jgi:hypothetical protein